MWRRHNDGFVVFSAKRVYNFVARAARVSHSNPETRVGNIPIYLLGQLRFQGSLYCFESEPWERGCSGMSVTDVIWCDVKVHFKVVKQHGFKCEWYVLFMKGWRLYSSSIKQCLLYIGESRPISQATKRARPTQERSIEQVAGNPRRGRFTIRKLHFSENGDLKSSARNEKEDERVHWQAVKSPNKSFLMS